VSLPPDKPGGIQMALSAVFRLKVNLLRGKLGGIPSLAGVFAPGELASPERGFENQKGYREKQTLPAGLSRRWRPKITFVWRPSSCADADTLQAPCLG